MLKYTAEELRALRQYNVTPPRRVRKIIFSYRLWLPRRERRRHGFSSRDGLSRATSTVLRYTAAPISCSRRVLSGGHHANLPAARSPKIATAAKFGLLNAQSVCNSSTAIVATIEEGQFDVFFSYRKLA